jgi:large subunit ribosomal protein L24
MSTVTSARIRLTNIMSKMGPKKSKPHLIRAAEKKHWNIVRGDKVQVIDSLHKEKGKQGIVLRVLRDIDRVIVEGINLVKTNIKGDRQRGIAARTIYTEKPIKYCAVNLVDPITNLPTRIFRKILDDGTKVRVSKKSGAIIPRPSILQVRARTINPVVTSSCTTEEDTWAISYQPKAINLNKK